MASLAYERLYAKGYRNLKVLDEGIPGWIEHGYPTEGRQAEGVPIPDYGLALGQAPESRHERWPR